MGITFNAEEILGIAEQIERNGAKFYRKAAESAENEEHRKLLLGLADMEVGHEKTFYEMKQGLTPAERESKDYDPQHQAAAYLRAIADGNVFDYRKDPSEMLTGDETISDVLSTAIGLQKDSVVFYMGIKEMVPERLGKERIADIIKEEMSHITLLSRQLAALKT